MTTVGLRLYGKYKILKYLVVYTVPMLESTGYEKMSSFKLESYSDRANCFGSLGRGQDGHASSVRSPSLSTVPYSMKNLIACFHFSSNVQHSITAVLQPQK